MRKNKETWWKEAVVYQIYPRSFMDSNGDGIGDLQGIIHRLDYLADLGVDVIWLSPIYDSPNDDNGYDIRDYQRIMKEFGTMDDFDMLLEQAHQKGLKIMMDLVVNHTSDEHEWFVKSRQNTDNPYRDYYIWREGKKSGLEPNNWESCFSGSAWQYDETREMFYLHLFSKKQPDLNWENSRVRHAVYDMMRWWCDKGIDGFRMDVINMISKDEELPDGKNVNGLFGDFSPYVMNGPKVHEFLREMHDEVLSHYDLMTVGETPNVTTEEAKKYAGEETNELNMIFQFEHVEFGGEIGKWTDKKIPLVELKRIMSKWQTELEGHAWNSLYWNNHDQPRAVSRFGDDRPQYREISAKMLATCLHFMKGTPYIYQGEELGMTNYPFSQIDQFKDIESINAYKEIVGNQRLEHDQMMSCLRFKSRDNARTPMQWSNNKQGGFTTGKPWLPVNPNKDEVNAEVEVNNPNSVYHYYKKIIQLRKKHSIIVYGDYELLEERHEQLFVYRRCLENEHLLVLCNFSDEVIKYKMPMQLEQYDVIITNNQRKVLESEMELQPYEAFVIKY
jgi:oligo-1,6-glucosidase